MLRKRSKSGGGRSSKFRRRPVGVLAPWGGNRSEWVRVGDGRARTSNRYIRSAARPALGVEKKFIDLDHTDGQVGQGFVSINQGGTIVPSLNTIALGDGEAARDGRKCTILSYHIRGELVNNMARPCTIRLIVYKDTQTNGAAALPTEIMEPWPGAGGVVSSNTMRNLEYTGRFKILKDRWITAPGPNDSASANETTKIFKIDGKLKMTINWNSNSSTGSVTNIRDNNIGILCLAEYPDNDISPGTFQKLFLHSRVRFVG